MSPDGSFGPLLDLGGSNEDICTYASVMKVAASDHVEDLRSGEAKNRYRVVDADCFEGRRLAEPDQVAIDVIAGLLGLPKDELVKEPVKLAGSSNLSQELIQQIEHGRNRNLFITAS